jgi:hypothetical protein
VHSGGEWWNHTQEGGRREHCDAAGIRSPPRRGHGRRMKPALGGPPCRRAALLRLIGLTTCSPNSSRDNTPCCSSATGLNGVTGRPQTAGKGETTRRELFRRSDIGSIKELQRGVCPGNGQNVVLTAQGALLLKIKPPSLRMRNGPIDRVNGKAGAVVNASPGGRVRVNQDRRHAPSAHDSGAIPKRGVTCTTSSQWLR